MSDTKDIDADALQLAKELIADDSGDMPIDYFDVVELLAKLVAGREHWRMQVPVTLDDVADVTGDQIRGWLTARGWLPGHRLAPNRRHRHLGEGRRWDRDDGRWIVVFIRDTTQGMYRTIMFMAELTGTNQREVIDQLAATARIHATIRRLAAADEQIDDIAYQVGMTNAEVMAIVGES